jgi:prepilin-type N-terminal cleavage/methylation domain-containing protein
VKASTGGFTLAEVLVAILILSVGLLAIAANSGSVYRMLGYGQRSTAAANVATSRMDWLRREANRTSPRCSALVSGADTLPMGVVEVWTITGTGWRRAVLLVVTSPSGRGLTVDSLYSVLECR